MHRNWKIILTLKSTCDYDTRYHWRFENLGSFSHLCVKGLRAAHTVSSIMSLNASEYSQQTGGNVDACSENEILQNGGKKTKNKQTTRETVATKFWRTHADVHEHYTELWQRCPSVNFALSAPRNWNETSGNFFSIIILHFQPTNCQRHQLLEIKRYITGFSPKLEPHVWPHPWNANCLYLN